MVSLGWFLGTLPRGGAESRHWVLESELQVMVLMPCRVMSCHVVSCRVVVCGVALGRLGIFARSCPVFLWGVFVSWLIDCRHFFAELCSIPWVTSFRFEE